MDFKISLAQINSTVGDIGGNAGKIIDAIRIAEEKNADIVVFPELSLCGYPPLDLVLENDFINANAKMIEKIAENTGNIIALVGYVRRYKNKLWNAIAVIRHGKVIDHVHKINLPTYDVFDELRYFSYVNDPRPVEVEIRGQKCKLGIEICEDLWDDRYETKVTGELITKGADIIINASASPFQVGKVHDRINIVRKKVKDGGVPFVYNNLVGGQDELIFDGNGFALDAKGNFAAFLPASKEFVAFCEFKDGMASDPLPEPVHDEMDTLKKALILGIRDYFYKSGFKDAVVGLSGGIDSALVAALATEALGKDHVYGFSMPSKF